MRTGSFGLERDVARAYEWLAQGRRKRIGSGDGRSRPGLVERARRLAAQSAPRRRMAAARRRGRAPNAAKYDLGVHYFWGFRMLGREQRAEPTTSVIADETQSLAVVRPGGGGRRSGRAISARLSDGEGAGLPNPQPEISERYYRLAAKGGNEDAEIDFADRLRLGHVLVKPENGSEEAIDLLQRALSQGSARAARRLALIYRNGELGEPKSPLKAMNYAYRAIDLSTLTRSDDERRQSDERDPGGHPARGNGGESRGRGHQRQSAADQGRSRPARALLRQGRSGDEEGAIRRLEVPLACGGSTPGKSGLGMGLGPQRIADRAAISQPSSAKAGCTVDPVLRATLIASYQTAQEEQCRLRRSDPAADHRRGGGQQCAKQRANEIMLSCRGLRCDMGYTGSVGVC